MGLIGEEKEIGDGGGFQGGVDDAPPPLPENQENSVAGARVIRYRECLRNHAVSIGGSVTDGCGEFMPAGEEGTVASLKCAACNCHRNFHRQETPHGGAPPLPNPPALPSFASMTHRHNAWASLAAQSPKTFGGAPPPTTAGAATAAPATVASSFQEPNFNPHKCFTSAPFPSPATATAATAAPVANSFQEPNFNPHKCFTSAPFPSPATAAAATAVPAPAAVDTSFQESIFNPHKCFTSAPFPSPSTTAAATAPVPSPPSAAETRGKKRFRTKFTADQKEKMTEFADKIGWRIPREEENINGVERFCGEIGVKRQIFKVWMHNNKSSAKPNATSPSQSSSLSINQSSY